MARLLHLSDLHFGRDRPGLAAALAEQAAGWAPDLAVVTGDLTQRALAGQYRAAAALIAALPCPVIAVPGNHDLPLWNPVARFLWPLRGWRGAIARDPEPMAGVPGLRLVGMNTADPFAWERGRITGAALRRACARIGAAPPGQLRVVAMHHPLHQPPQSGKAPMPGADAALQALAAAGADVVLCGHLHRWAAMPFAQREGGRNLLFVQAGTTLSTRLRGEENDLNLIAWDGATVTVTRMAAVGESLDFAPAGVTRFHQPDAARGWAAEATAPKAGGA